MKMNDIPNAYVDYENKIFNKAQTINKLRKDGQDMEFELDQAKEEIKTLKEKISHLEKFSKKTPTKLLETINYRDECENLKILINRNQENFLEKEKKLLTEIKTLKDALENNAKKREIMEEKLKEKSNEIQKLSSELSEINKDTYDKLPESLLMPNSPKVFAAKEKHPPRVFEKVFQISKEKGLLVSIFLSLLDKNNNGLIDCEELKRGLTFHGRPLKNKHLTKVLKIMNIKGNFISLRLFEEWFEKYEYDPYESSSEEEIKQPLKPKIETLSFKEVKPDPKYSEIIIPQVSLVPNLPKEKNLPLIKAFELNFVFERMKLFMQDHFLLPNKLLGTLFDNFDFDALYTAQEIAEILENSNIYLGNHEEIMKFSRFLIEPEGVDALPESKLLSLKGKVMDFSKKFKKYAPDWKIIDRYKAQTEVYLSMISKKSEILESFKYLDSNKEELINLSVFIEIIKRYFEFSENGIHHMFLMSYSITKQLDVIHYNAVYNGLELKKQYHIQKHSQSFFQKSSDLP